MMRISHVFMVLYSMFQITGILYDVIGSGCIIEESTCTKKSWGSRFIARRFKGVAGKKPTLFFFYWYHSSRA